MTLVPAGLKAEDGSPFEIRTLTEPEIVFASSVRHLMPAIASVPEEFGRNGNPWNKIVSRWFFHGVDPDVFVNRDGVDEGLRKNIFRQASAIMRSWEPTHEHKEMAVGYLLSLFFETPTPRAAVVAAVLEEQDALRSQGGAA